MAVKISQRYENSRRSKSSEPVRELTQKLSYVILYLVTNN